MTELNFNGKEFVYNHHLAVPHRPIVPDAKKSVGQPDLSGNLIIEGDNLHALKSLLPLYAGKVDCIFIDPPYNTGNEKWCYNDNVNAPMIQQWFDDNPVKVDDGLRHDKWCAMMWPRLKLLHELLAEDGVIIITIDDNEYENLQAICKTIFGEENYIGTVVRKTKLTSNKGTFFAPSHEYILFYGKDTSNLSGFDDEDAQKNDDYLKLFRYEDEYSKYNIVALFQPALDPMRGCSNQRYYIQCPDGSFVIPAGNVFPSSIEDGSHVAPLSSEDKVWRWSYQSYLEYDKANLVFIETKTSPLLNEKGEQAKWNVYTKIYLKDRLEAGARPVTFLDRFPNSAGSKELIKLDIPFDFPKPTSLIEYLLRIVGLKKDALILDSFAGSGTTAHAVLQANKLDGGNRKFILVEMQDNIANPVTAERVRRVINGYQFKGTQKTELLRENINYSSLENANKILDEVQSIENLHGHEYDKINKTIKDGVLTITGENNVKEKTKGLGGTFTYCTLGEAIDMDKILTGNSLLNYEDLAPILFHTATNQTLDPKTIKASTFFVGETKTECLWMIYKPDLEWLKSEEAALTLTRAKAFVKTNKEKRHLVFAPSRFVSQKVLKDENLAVDFIPLPFALYRVEKED